MGRLLRATPLAVAFFSVALWALLLVVTRVVLSRYDIDPWAFALIQLVSGGSVLIVRSKRSSEVDWRSIRRTRTWVYGVLRVTTATAFTAALVHTTVTYAGLLGTINVVLGVLGARLVFGRRPSGAEVVAHCVVVAGVVAVVALRLEDGVRNPAVALMLISEVAVVASSLLAEAHPDNNASDPSVRLRFTGTVLVLTALLFLMIQVPLRVLADGSTTLDLYFSPSLWISGLIVGIVLRGPAMHSSLQAIRLAGTEVYLMATASLPFFGLIFEYSAGHLGLIAAPQYEASDLVLLATIAIGAVAVLGARQRVARRVRTPSRISSER